MNSAQELQTAGRERESAWCEYELGPQYLTSFVAEHSAALVHFEYDLRSLFSEQALKAVLAHGVTTIDANRRGLRMFSIGSGGLKEGSLEDGAKLLAVFRKWAETGHVHFELASGEGTSEARLLVR
ncbi:hypothetical protein DBR42_25400 [Pelomonas sp. HMWF004]|nr:hypothetical protein DBR42_25400 [Pelomonas sp. HMWF004]